MNRNTENIPIRDLTDRQLLLVIYRNQLAQEETMSELVNAAQTQIAQTAEAHDLARQAQENADAARALAEQANARADALQALVDELSGNDAADQETIARLQSEVDGLRAESAEALAVLQSDDPAPVEEPEETDPEADPAA